MKLPRLLVAVVPFLLIALTSCATVKKDVSAVGSATAQIVADCSKQTIKDAIPNALPAVNQILIDSNKTEAAKDAALNQLSLSSSELLACTVREAFEDLSRLFIRGALSPDAVPAKDIASRYMQARFVYSDGFSPQ